MYTVYLSLFVLFFFNDTATSEIYTLSLPDALPIGALAAGAMGTAASPAASCGTSVWMTSRASGILEVIDRKSTRLNSSHANISYAVFCLKKKKSKNTNLGLYST